MSTFFNYEIEYNNRALVMSGGDTLELAKQKAQKDADYYISECKYKPLTIKIEETCKTCYNTGKIKKYNKRNKFLYKLIKCPDCLGIIPVYKEEYITE